MRNSGPTASPPVRTSCPVQPGLAGFFQFMAKSGFASSPTHLPDRFPVRPAGPVRFSQHWFTPIMEGTPTNFPLPDLIRGHHTGTFAKVFELFGWYHLGHHVYPIFVSVDIFNLKEFIF